MKWVEKRMGERVRGMVMLIVRAEMPKGISEKEVLEVIIAR